MIQTFDRHLLLGLIVTGLLLGCLCAPLPVYGDDVGGLQEVIAAWNHRQDEIRTFHFSWSGTQFAGKGHADAAQLDMSAEPIPPKDTSFDITMVFAVDEKGRVLLQYDGNTWSSEKNQYVPKTTRDIFDGQLRKVFFPQGVKSFPNLHISNNTASDTARDLRAAAIRMVYRPFDTTMGVFDPSKLAITERKGVVENRQCLILSHTQDTQEEMIWVDPSRSFLPLRHTIRRRGVIAEQTEISYREDPSNGWVPALWNNALLDKDGNTMKSWSGKVTQYQLNEPIPDSTFETDYPPGTYVQNYVTRENYILREGGGRRPILPGEYKGDNYEEILNSEPPSSNTMGRWIASVSGGSFIVVLVYLRRRRTKR